MKQGSALLSLLIGMVIASGIFMVLTNALNQFITLDYMLSNAIEQTERLIVVEKQIEKDLSGVCVIHQAALNKKQGDKKQEPQKNAPERKKEKKDEKKPLAECFYLIGDQTEKVEISFITNNGNQDIWPELPPKKDSFLKRVSYSIKKDPNHKGSYSLIRKEGSDFTKKFYQQTSIEGTVLLDHIASIKITATYRISIKEKKETKKDLKEKKTKKKQFTLKKTPIWNDEFVYSKKSKVIYRIPELITITYELFDATYTKTNQYIQNIQIIADGLYGSQEAAKKSTQVPNPIQNKKEEKITLPPMNNGMIEIQNNIIKSQGSSSQEVQLNNGFHGIVTFNPFMGLSS